MKINANEMLLINKNLKFKGEETETVTNPNASILEVPEGEEGSNALKAQAVNNIAFQGVNAGLKKLGLNSLLALSLLGGAASISSCTTEEGDSYFNVYNTITTHLTVNTYMTDEELVKAVLDEIKALREENQKQTEINQAMLNELLRQGISIDRILTLLEKMDMTAADILKMLNENNEKQDAMLNTITNGNQEQKELLLQILNAVNNGNALTADNNKTLTLILVQMGKADQNDKETIAILNAILNKVNESIQTQKAIAAKQAMFMQAVLGKLSEIDDHLKQGVMALLNKIDSVSEANLELLTKMFNSIEEGNQNDKLTNEIITAIYNKVNESIEQNHDLTEKTHEMLWMIMDSMSVLSDEMKQAALNIMAHIDNASEAEFKLLTKIYSSVNEGNENDKLTNEILISIYNKTEESIKQNHEMSEKTHEMLWMIMDNMDAMNNIVKQGVIEVIKHIDNASDANIALLMKLISTVDGIDINDNESAKILNQILTEIRTAIEQNKDIDAKTQALFQSILDNIQNFNGDLKRVVQDVLDKMDAMNNIVKQGVIEVIKHIDNASDANIALLMKLISTVDGIDINDNESAKILNQILTEIRTAIEQNKDVDAKTQALLQSILDNIQNFNGDLKRAVQDVLDKMDQLSAENKILLGDILNNVQNFNNDMKNGFAVVVDNMAQMSAQDRAFYKMILGKLDNMDDNAKSGIAMLVKQMAENNTLTEMQLNKLKVVIDKLDKASEADKQFYNQAIALMSELMSKVDKLGNKADSILGAISNISLDANVDLSKIEKMLGDLLAQSKVNGDVLTSIDGKMNFIGVTVEGIKTSVERMGGDHSKIIAKLDEILKKIPEGCKCNASLQVIIEKLDKVVEEIKKGNNHEGILDDLDDLENMFG